VIVAALLQFVPARKHRGNRRARKGNHPNQRCRTTPHSNVQELKNQLQAERQKNSRRQWPPLRWEIQRSRLRLPAEAAAAAYGPTGVAVALYSGPALLASAAGQHADATHAVQQQAQLIAAKERERS